MNAFEDRLQIFLRAVRQSMPHDADTLIHKGLSDFSGLTDREKMRACSLARCPLRLCIGLMPDPDRLFHIFGSMYKNHPALYCLDDLLARFPKAKDQVPLLPIPFRQADQSMISTMKHIHLIQYQAELYQDIDFGIINVVD